MNNHYHITKTDTQGPTRLVPRNACDEADPIKSDLGSNMQIELLLLKRSTRTVPSRFVSQTGRLEWSIRLTLDPSTIQLQDSNQSQKNPSKQKIPKKRRRKTPKELFRERCFKKDGSRKKKPESKLPIDQRKASGRSTQDS